MCLVENSVKCTGRGKTKILSGVGWPADLLPGKKLRSFSPSGEQLYFFRKLSPFLPSVREAEASSKLLVSSSCDTAPHHNKSTTRIAFLSLYSGLCPTFPFCRSVIDATHPPATPGVIRSCSFAQRSLARSLTFALASLAASASAAIALCNWTGRRASFLQGKSSRSQWVSEWLSGVHRPCF